MHNNYTDTYIPKTFNWEWLYTTCIILLPSSGGMCDLYIDENENWLIGVCNAELIEPPILSNWKHLCAIGDKWNILNVYNYISHWSCKTVKKEVVSGL